MVEQLFTHRGETDTGRDQEEQGHLAKSETTPHTLGKAIVKATATLCCQTGGNSYHAACSSSHMSSSRPSTRICPFGARIPVRLTAQPIPLPCMSDKHFVCQLSPILTH
jgi:hypothetical protein